MLFLILFQIILILCSGSIVNNFMINTLTELGPRKNGLFDEADIVQKLSLFCKDEPILCQKEGQGGLSSNQRIIMVRDQFFEYYKKPDKFQNRDIKTLKGSPKARVNLSDICEVTFLPEGKQKKKILTMDIPINKIQTEEKERYKSDSKKDNHLVKWKFSFDFDLKTEINEKINRELNERKKANLRLNDHQEKPGNSFLNISQHKEGDESEANQLKEDYNAQQELDKNVEKLKELQNFMAFKEEVEKKQKERQNVIKKILNQKGQKDSSEFSQLEEEIYPIRSVWRDYSKAYEAVSKMIDQPVSSQYFKKQLKLLSEIQRVQEEVKLIAVAYINQKLVGWSKQAIMFGQFEFYKGVWIKTGGKELNQEFLSNAYLADIAYALRQIKKVRYRVPLMYFIKYKGFKMMCMIDMPFSSNIIYFNREVYSLQKLVSFIDKNELDKYKQGLQFFERALNIHCQDKAMRNKKDRSTYPMTAPLSWDLKIFQYDNKYEQQSLDFVENFHYLVGIKGLFPLDYNYQSTQKFEPQCWLRPQIIAEYRDLMESGFMQHNELLTQAFRQTTISSLEDQAREDNKVKDASQLIFSKLRYFINQLVQVNYIIVDSYSLKCYMSDLGINSRYLGHLHSMTEIPYLQETFQIEMLSRTVKKIYEQSIKDLISDENFFQRGMYAKNQLEIMEEVSNEHHKKLVSSCIDYLNLVFGKSVETDAFWEIVLRKCWEKYSVKIKYPLSLNPGCLLLAVLWHCQIIVKYSLQTPLFKVQKPFKVADWIQFRVKSKKFQFPSLEIIKSVKKLAVLDEADEQSKKFIFPLLKLQMLYQNEAHGLNFTTQHTLAKINNFGENFDKPLRQYPYHPSQLTYYFTNKSPQNFKKAFDILNFSLAANHPLFISLYDTYSTEFDPQLMKKSSLLASIKGLGQFHPQTTKLYCKYYREGDAEFQIKAKRSKTIDASYIICKQFYEKQKYETCMHFCLEKIKTRSSIKQNNQIQMYIRILRFGLSSAVSIRSFNQALIITEQYSQVLNLYRIREPENHDYLLFYCLIIRLTQSNYKFYLYKMVLLAIKIQEDHQKKFQTNSEGFKLPRKGEEKEMIINGIINEYYLKQTHSKWIQDILRILKQGYLYFNHLNDLFNNYRHHLTTYNNRDFKRALGYLDILIRYFGQKIFHDCLYNIGP